LFCGGGVFAFATTCPASQGDVRDEKAGAGKMAAHLKLKILLVGPEKCGKSQMANFLADLTESLPGPDAPYTPTAGARRGRLVGGG
jgi:hypothetical protein